jgi:hypothetical protein
VKTIRIGFQLRHHTPSLLRGGHSTPHPFKSITLARKIRINFERNSCRLIARKHALDSPPGLGDRVEQVFFVCAVVRLVEVGDFGDQIVYLLATRSLFECSERSSINWRRISRRSS